MINKSMSIYINRDLCLETGARFRDYQHRCLFNLSTAENFLQDVTTCPNKCNFQIENLHPLRNSLQAIKLTMGNGEKMFHSCGRSYYHTDVYLNINCSLWNAREYIIWDDVYASSINDAQCIHINNYCVCHCMPGYILEDKKCLKMNVSIGGLCGFDWQCNGTQFANVCDHGLCSCSPGYIEIKRKCFMYHGNLELNDSCGLTEQCIQPFSICLNGTCKCIDGFSPFDTDSCFKDTVPVGGFCSLDEQCTGSDNSGICGHGRCTCAKEFILIDLACEKDMNIRAKLGTFFGGFILGAIVTAVVTTLMYRKFKFPSIKIKKPAVLFAGIRAYGATRSAQISYTNDKKQNVAIETPKETLGYNLYEKQENERSDDVYNHLHEQTEQDDDNYDHACAPLNHSTDLSDYNHLCDITSVQSTSL
nr:uncharacterized protein LOC105345467 isoform X1 [Crassostrea gigas]